MKIKEGFILRDVADKTFVVAVGELSKTFNGIITLNETGKFIWQLLTKDTTEEEIVEKLLIEFEDAQRDVVEKDVKSFIEKLKGDRILEG
ncbi:MAG: PqqD family protein [Ruminococcaceae bacterium]|nr:PqqD family protein [Oscillospiraceae bacterium]